MEHLQDFAEIIRNPLLKNIHHTLLVGEGKDFDSKILVGQFS